MAANVRGRNLVVAMASAILLTIALSSCSRSTATSDGRDLAVLKVGALPFLSHGPVFIAQDEGFYAEQGLKVEFSRAVRSSEMLPALAAGQLDVLAGTISTSFLNAITREAVIKIVASKGHINETGCVAHAMMARKALVEGGALQRVSQIRGLRVAAPRGSWSRYFLETLLAREGLGIRDVQVLDLPDSVMPGAFAAGTLDVATASEPWIARLLEGGSAVTWIPAQEIVPGFHQGLIVYGPNLLVDKPDVGRRFMVAYLKAVRRYNEGKTPRNVAILAKYTDLDPSVIEATCWSPFKVDGLIDVESVLGFQRWGLANKLVDRPIAPAAFWDSRFVEGAATELFPASSNP